MAASRGVCCALAASFWFPLDHLRLRTGETMLPSQIGRPSSSRAHMYRRKRSRTIPLAIAGLVVFAVVFVVARFWIGGSHTNSVGAASTTDQTAGTVSPLEVADAKAAIGRQNRATGAASPSNATSKSNGTAPETKISMGDGLRGSPNHSE